MAALGKGVGSSTEDCIIRDGSTDGDVLGKNVGIAVLTSTGGDVPP